MKKVTVHVTLKEGILDPQGQTIETSLHSLGFTEVEEVRTGKTIELLLNDQDNVEARVQAMCTKLLANPVIEDYQLHVEEALQS
ncbi:phosphoribosylformylglycinamidine synthase subunit PurS [Lentibacillus lipolyticus]|nr:phosphoribosylformylglycinamidine synthase subunit PurS [Lentibacillus lipolyticus]